MWALEVPTGELQPPPAMPKPWCESSCLDWDAERGVHGCQSSDIQLSRDRGLGDSVANSRWAARRRRSQLRVGDTATAAQPSKPCLLSLCLPLQGSVGPRAPGEGHV